jgi:predicted glycoside hydrolase/deacetylase ChbG (UPF0249 family)
MMNQRSHNLCITADDYGLSEGVNAGIEALVDLRRITAVSIMVHQDAQLSSVNTLQKYDVATGLHLVLVEELPLGQTEKLGKLLGKDGLLPPNYCALFKRIMGRPGLLRAVRHEAEAQIARYLALGLRLDFINSHQHVHLFPPIWYTLAPVFEQYRVPVRAVRRFASGFSKQAVLDLSAWVAWKVRPLRYRATFRPIGVDYAGHCSLRKLQRILETRLIDWRSIPGETPELVLHPGYTDQRLLSRYRHWNYQWQEELELLRSADFPQLLTQHAVHRRVPRHG